MTLPLPFKDRALDLWWVVLGGFAVCAFLTWIERDADRKPFDPAGYTKVVKALREAYDGMLALVYFATIAGASLAGLFVFIGARTHAQWLPQMSIEHPRLRAQRVVGGGVRALPHLRPDVHGRRVALGVRPLAAP